MKEKIQKLLNQEIVFLNTNTSINLVQKEEAEEIFELTDKNRAYLKEWLPWLDNTAKLEDTESFIQSYIETFEGNKAPQITIKYKDKIAGMIGLHEIEWEKESSAIGYWVAEEYQGLGLITEACKFLFAYAFEELQLKIVNIRCAVENKKSRAVPIRLGLKEVGLKENAEYLYGKVVDHIIYEVTSEEYFLNKTAKFI